MALFMCLSITRSLYFFICVYKHIALKNNEALLSDVKDKNSENWKFLENWIAFQNAKSSENGNPQIHSISSHFKLCKSC